MRKSLIFIFMIVSCGLYISVSASAKEYTEEDAEKGFVYQEQMELINHNIYINSSRKQDGYYIGVGYSLSESIGIEYQGFPSVLLYENGALVFNKVIDYFGYGEFTKLLLVEDYIYIGGTVEVQGVLKPIFIKMDYDGQIYKHKVIECNENTHLIDFYLLDNKLFVFLNTISPYIDKYEVDKSLNMLCFVKIDFDFVIEDLNCIGNNGYNKIYQILHYKELFYIYGEVSGEGDFYFNNDSQKIVYVLDKYGAIPFELYVPKNILGTNSISVIEDEVYLINRYSLSDQISLYKEKGSSFEKTETLTISKEVNDFFVINMFERMIMIYYYVENNIGYLNICDDQNRQYVITLVDDTSYKTINIDNIKFEDEKICLSYYEVINGVDYFYYSDLVLVQKNENEYYFNYCPVKGMLLDDGNITFGKYNDILKFCYSDLVIYIDGELEVPLKINVVNKGVYDVGIKLNANGTMYLNNTLIENDFLIKEEGDYILEIVGSEKVVYIMFKVKKMSISNFDVEMFDYTVEDIEVNQMSNECVTFSSKQKVMEHNNAYDFIVICIFVSVIGLMVGFFGIVFIYRRLK